MKIKILGNLYKVEYVKELIDEEGRELLGNCQWDQATIKISKKYPEQRQLQALLHEIIHCIDFENNLGLTEAKVDAMANTLYAVILDNPEIFKKIIKTKAEK